MPQRRAPPILGTKFIIRTLCSIFFVEGPHYTFIQLSIDSFLSAFP